MRIWTHRLTPTALAGLRPSTRFAVFAVPALIACAGCDLTETTGECLRLSDGRVFEARKYGNHWDYRDQNDLRRIITHRNSDQFDCRVIQAGRE